VDQVIWSPTFPVATGAQVSELIGQLKAVGIEHHEPKDRP
jgi:hypothetical protein